MYEESFFIPELKEICTLENLYKVFVYGTLRKHERNHNLLKDSKCIALQSWTYGSLYDTGLNYPAMVQQHSKRVYGELYEVNKEQLYRLDELEGYNGPGQINLYERITQTIFTDTGSEEAFLYVQTNVKKQVEILFGDWKCYQYLNSEELLYFAYGSCMDNDRFIKAGVDQHFQDLVGCGVAPRFTLAYTLNYADGGRADMVESDDYVEGKVYRVNKEAIKYLLIREGVYSNLYRAAFIDVTINGTLHKNVLTFLVINKEQEIAPPIHYATEILRGAKGHVSKGYYQKLEDKLLNTFNMKL